VLKTVANFCGAGWKPAADWQSACPKVRSIPALTNFGRSAFYYWIDRILPSTPGVDLEEFLLTIVPVWDCI
jgi:hypothetical protein